MNVNVTIDGLGRFMCIAETLDSIVQTDPLLVSQVEETVERSEKEKCNLSNAETGSHLPTQTISGDVSPELLPSCGVETTAVPSGNYVQNFSHVSCRISSVNPFLLPERHLISLFDFFLFELVCLACSFTLKRKRKSFFFDHCRSLILSRIHRSLSRPRPFHKVDSHCH